MVFALSNFFIMLENTGEIGETEQGNGRAGENRGRAAENGLLSIKNGVGMGENGPFTP
jgi:hypothetical protein